MFPFVYGRNEENYFQIAFFFFAATKQNTKNDFPIKCIQVIDNILDGKGGFASIIEGGMNQKSTKILLTSLPGGRLSFKITIFTYNYEGLRPPYQHASPYQHTAPYQQASPAIGWQHPPAAPNTYQHYQPQQQQTHVKPAPWNGNHNYLPRVVPPHW